MRLARLSERELRDMGIDQSDIARIAYQEAPAASSSPAPVGYSPYVLAAG
jgi:hypothetical protein